MIYMAPTRTLPTMTWTSAPEPLALHQCPTTMIPTRTLTVSLTRHLPPSHLNQLFSRLHPRSPPLPRKTRMSIHVEGVAVGEIVDEDVVKIVGEVTEGVVVAEVVAAELANTVTALGNNTLLQRLTSITLTQDGRCLQLRWPLLALQDRSLKARITPHKTTSSPLTTLGVISILTSTPLTTGINSPMSNLT